MKDAPNNIHSILIVCVGNICRSPMAEAVLRDALQDERRYCVSSAGLGALVGRPATESARTLMEERGLDISAHRARQLTPKIVHENDLVLVMETGHARAIADEEPTTRGKVFRLCKWQGSDIPDPYRQSRNAFEVALALIDKGVASWVEKIRPPISGNAIEESRDS